MKQAHAWSYHHQCIQQNNYTWVKRSPLLEKLEKWLHAKTGGPFCHPPQWGDAPSQRMMAAKVGPFAHPVCPGPLHLGRQAGHQYLRQCSLSKLFPRAHRQWPTDGLHQGGTEDPHCGPRGRMCCGSERSKRPEVVTFCYAFLSVISHCRATCCRPTRPYSRACRWGESARATLFAWVLVAGTFHVNDLKGPWESLS